MHYEEIRKLCRFSTRVINRLIVYGSSRCLGDDIRGFSQQIPRSQFRLGRGRGWDAESIWVVHALKVETRFHCQRARN